MLEIHSSMPQPGDRIGGKYRVERMLGAGGMGCVLAAEHVILRTRVAIKMLLPQASGVPGATERFLREAQAAATLRSEHVARVVDVGSTDDGAPFLVMEHLTGQDLRKIARERGPLPVGEVVEYLLQTCDAIVEAHSRGIIHRDLKPSNIFVTTRPNGSPLVKVLDFGLAKVLDPARVDVPEESITHSGLVVGSPHYMSPEQFRSLRKADARSDIWALGVIGYELLAGRRPFLGEGMAGVMMSVVADNPEPLDQIRPDLPAPLVALIMKCLDKTPDRRPQWVSEIIGALKSLTFSAPAWPGVSDTSSIPESDRAASGFGPAAAMTAEVSDEAATAPHPRNTPSGPAVLPPRPGRSTWRMVDPSPELIAARGALPSAADTTTSDTGKGVSVGPDDAWADVVEARRVARSQKARRRWFAAGAVVALGAAAFIGVRTFGLGQGPVAGDDATTKEPVTAAPVTAAPSVSTQVAPAPQPAQATAAAPAEGAPPAPSVAPAPSVTPAAADAAPPASGPKTKAKRPSAPKATSKAGSPDPFGKYD